MTSATRPLLPFRVALLFALASGPVLDAGFPDRGWWPSTFLGIGLVLASLRGRRPRAALLLGFLAGMSFYLVHIEWASLFLGWLPMTALSVLESLFVALGALLISFAYRWCASAWPTRLGTLVLLPLIVAALWTCREAVESVWPYGGFAWGRVALSQSQSPFAHLFSWLGVSGVTFIMVAIVALILEMVRRTDVAALTRVGVPVIVVGLVLLVPAFPVTLKGTSTIAAVQGNGRAGYFDRAPLGSLLSAQYTASTPLFGRRVDMVVWPEGGSDIDPERDAEAAAALDDVSREWHAPLLVGTIQQRGNRYYNSSLLWEAGKGAVDHYDKKHPVPFGEYVPDRAFWKPFAPDLIGLIGREYTPGTTDTVFDVDGVIAGIDICFDISDDAVMRDSIAAGAQVLIAQSNNADFGRTDESVQQLAIARIRAMELGRSLVNISTVGTSAMIAPDGSTIGRQLPTYTAASMVHTVPLSSTVTPAALLGDRIERFISLFGLASVLLGGILERRNRAHRTKSALSPDEKGRGRSKTHRGTA